MKKTSPPLSARHAFGIIIPLCLFALLISALVISIANDMYAFVKPEKEFILSLSDGTGIDTISRTLEENGVVDNGFVFSLYSKSKGYEARLSSAVGEHRLNGNMSYREIWNNIFSKK